MKKVLLAVLAVLLCSFSTPCESKAESKQIVRKQILEYEGKYYQMIVNTWVEPDFTPNLYKHLCKLLFKEQASSIEEGFSLFIEHNAKDYMASPKRSKMIKRGLTNCRYRVVAYEYKPGHYATIMVKITNNLRAILPNEHKGNEQPELHYVFTYDLKNDRIFAPENVFADPSIVNDRDNITAFWVEQNTVCMTYNNDSDDSFTYAINDIGQYLTPEFKDTYGEYKPENKTNNLATIIPLLKGKTIKTREVMARENVGEQLFDVVQQMPQFPGGDAALFEYLSTHIKYPAIAEENKVQGRVIVTFVVERDGSISNVKVVKHVDPSLDREAMRVVATMPRWIPGKQNGETVRVKHTVPITFRLADPGKQKQKGKKKVSPASL